MPAFVVAYFTPKVSVQVEGNRLKISPQVKNDEPGHQHEHIRRVPQCAETPIGQRPEREYDRHCVLAGDDVGDPAEERARHAVQDVVDHERRAQRVAVTKKIVIGCSASPKSLAMGAICAVTTRPEAETKTNMT
jgi:hypothetical protein